MGVSQEVYLSFDLMLPAAQRPWVDLASIRNEYQFPPGEGWQALKADISAIC
jgi:hypothetical protein